MINRIEDNNFGVAGQMLAPKFVIPFDGDNTVYQIEQDYVINQSAFAPTALNTVADTSLTVPAGMTTTQFFLQKETEPQPVGCGDVVKWTRTYVSVPAARSEYSTTNYKFIGYAGDTALIKTLPDGTLVNYNGGTTYVQGRRPFVLTVPLILAKDYFMVGSGMTYATAALIPVNLALKYYMQIGNTAISAGKMTFTPTYTLGSPNDIANGIPSEYLSNPTTTNPYWFSPIGTSPTRDAYQALAAAGTAITIEDSSISRWMGNVWERTTKQVIAR